MGKLIVLPTEDIIKKYQNGMSCLSLAKEYQSSSYMIISILKKAHIPIKSAAEQNRLKLPENKIIKLYKKGNTTIALGKQYQCTHNVICNLLRRNKIKLRRRKNQPILYKNLLSCTYFTIAKKGAIKRNLSFELTLEILYQQWLKQDGKCALTNQQLVLKRNQRDYNRHTASIDRIDSSKGYLKNNIRWIHKDINKIKLHFSDEYFIEMCKLVAKNNL